MKSVKRTDWGRRTPPIGGSNFELYAWFFMRISGLFLVLLAAGHMFIMHVFNDTLNLLRICCSKMGYPLLENL